MGNRNVQSAKRRAVRLASKKPTKKYQVAKMERASFSLLPNEIIGLVAEYAHAVGGQRLLRNFGLTNRRVFAHAQRELYRHIIIQYEVELAHLTRSLIENPSLRAMIRGVALHTNAWRGRLHGSDRIFRDWHNTPMDMSKLSHFDRQLLIVGRSHCTSKGSDNIQCVFGLLLFLLDRAQEVTIEMDWYWSILDRFLAAGLSLSASLSSNSPLVPLSYSALLPAAHTLQLSTKFYLRKSMQTIYSMPFHPFKALTASANLRVFDFNGDMGIWGNLDNIDPDMKLPFTTVKLISSHCNSSTLCKFIRHCPELQHLEASTHGPSSDPGTEECINTVLPKFCPQLQKLILRSAGRNWKFFRNSNKTLTCLPQMTNLRELRIEADSFLLRPQDLDRIRLVDRLPSRLEKLFLDISGVLTDLQLHGKVTASRPEVKAYANSVENIIQGLCKARRDQFPHLNTVVFGSKYAKPVQWTKEANKALAGTGARAKVTSATETSKMWDYSWDKMDV